VFIKHFHRTKDYAKYWMLFNYEVFTEHLLCTQYQKALFQLILELNMCTQGNLMPSANMGISFALNEI
jgi:hypothetical protein